MKAQSNKNKVSEGMSVSTMFHPSTSQVRSLNTSRVIKSNEVSFSTQYKPNLMLPSSRSTAYIIGPAQSRLIINSAHTSTYIPAKPAEEVPTATVKPEGLSSKSSKKYPNVLFERQFARQK